MSSIKLNVSYSVARDSHIWQELKAGNRSALDRIYYMHVPALMAYGRPFTKNAPLIDDCIQELFVDLWVKRERLGDISSIRFYLIKALKRRILRSLKKEEKKTCFTDLEDVFFEHLIFYPSDLPGEDAFDKIKMMKLVDELSPLQKEIIFLKFFNELSFDEISQVLELSKKQLYNALSKAMNRLRKLMVVLLCICCFLL